MGGILGILHGIILKAALISLSDASFILYGDTYLLPIRVTLIIDIVIAVTIIAFAAFYPFIEALADIYATKRV